MLKLPSLEEYLFGVWLTQIVCFCHTSKIRFYCMQVFHSIFSFFFRFVILNLLFVEGIKIFCLARLLRCCCSLSCCFCWCCCCCCCYCCLVPSLSRLRSLLLCVSCAAIGFVIFSQPAASSDSDSFWFIFFFVSFRFCIFQFLFYGFSGNCSCCCCYQCFVSFSVDSSHMNLCLIFHLSWVCLLKLAHVAYVWYVCVYLHGEMALLLSNTTLPLTHSPRTSYLPPFPSSFPFLWRSV